MSTYARPLFDSFQHSQRLSSPRRLPAAHVGELRGSDWGAIFVLDTPGTRCSRTSRRSVQKLGVHFRIQDGRAFGIASQIWQTMRDVLLHASRTGAWSTPQTDSCGTSCTAPCWYGHQIDPPQIYRCSPDTGRFTTALRHETVLRTVHATKAFRSSECKRGREFRFSAQVRRSSPPLSILAAHYTHIAPATAFCVSIPMFPQQNCQSPPSR